MRVARHLVAALALTLAVPAAANAATITVSAHNEVAGDTTSFTFHVKGPHCAAGPAGLTDITFALTDGQSRTLTLCDSPPTKADRFQVTQEVPAGWQLVAIDCSSTDTDPVDAFIIERPTAFVELSPDEDKSCAFRNRKDAAPSPLPEVPVTAAPAAVSPPPAPAPPPPPVPQAVLGATSTSPLRPAAQLGVPSVCTKAAARVTVTSRLMRHIRFSVNGRAVRTVDVARGARRLTASVPLRRTGPAVQTVTARVSFRTGARPRTLSAQARRCAQAAVAPSFTG